MESHFLPDETKIIDTDAFGCSVIDLRVLNALQHLYDLTDWRWILIDGDIEREYNGLSTVALFKALALPYIVILPSERALSKILASNNKIQEICGFTPNKLPRTRTFWHFRNKYKKAFPSLMLKVLMSLVLSGKSPLFNLPFVEQITEHEIDEDTERIDIEIDSYRWPISVYTKFDPVKKGRDNQSKELFTAWQNKWKAKFRESRNFDEYKQNYEQYRLELTKLHHSSPGLLEELTFPIDVSTKLVNNHSIYFRLVPPPWFKKAKYKRLIQKPSKKPYDKACNILILREIGEEQEVLICRRKSIGYGHGEYALPGGKQKPGESMEECASRELLEETNLVLKKSRPISIFVKKNPDGSESDILSVGVMAIDWSGEVNTNEPERHDGWEWYKISNLPSPLFPPTQIAISHFINNKFPNLNWDDIEKNIKQLPLF
jgi:8-oxo-dGTP diphosphatase